MKEAVDSNAAKPRRILVLLLNISALPLLSLRLAKASCFDNTPTGMAQCIHIPRFNGSQWTTCVSDLYIRQKSKGRHGCNLGHENCLYQCMLEVHDSNSGPVHFPCGCSVNDQVETDAASVKLQPRCFSPTGADCSWYRNCLCRSYNCRERFGADVVALAEQLCKLYLNAYARFTPKGSFWINGARKCLQVNLVPLLRRWQPQNSSEEDLTEKTMSSFRDCFLGPFPGIPSICDLPSSDLWGIFWSLRQTLEVNSRRGLRMLLEKIENCTQFRQMNFNSQKVRKQVLSLKRILPTDLTGYLRKTSKFEENEILAQQLGKKINKKLHLERRGIAWFSYSLSVTSEQSTKVAFFLADKRAYRTNHIRPRSDLDFDLDNVVSELTKAIRRKRLGFQSAGVGEKYSVTGMVVCNDIQCTQNTRKVSLECHSSGSFPSLFWYSAVYNSGFVLVLLFVHVVLFR